MCSYIFSKGFGWLKLISGGTEDPFAGGSCDSQLSGVRGPIAIRLNLAISSLLKNSFASSF
jgi:hypothetical protein